MKSACLEEITHLICDADKKVNRFVSLIFLINNNLYNGKVNIMDVSNNWNVSHRDSEKLLLDWIAKNKNRRLNSEFLVRGVDKDGNCVITVIRQYK